MSEQSEPSYDMVHRSPGKAGSARTFGVIIGLFLVIWVAVLSLRWELRAQYWAHQVIESETLEDRDYYLTRLASIGDKSIHAVHALIKDPRPEIRHEAVTVLKYVQDQQAAPLLIGMLTDPDHGVVAVAATTLARRREAQDYLPQLESMLANSSAPGAWGAVVAIGRIGGEQAERMLMDMLAKPQDADLKAQLIDSLGLLDCKAAVPLMAEALEDHRLVQVLPQSQQSAQRALAVLQPELASRGTNAQATLSATTTAPTVAAIAARWIQLIGNNTETPPVQSSPASAPE